MGDDDAIPKREIEVLERELAFARREAEQWRRTAERSEVISSRSKHVMLSKQLELERTIEALQEANAQVVEAGNAKTRFLAALSHEIRTPINGVIGALELLLDAELEPEHRELTRIMESSAQTLVSVIGGVLDYSRVNSSALELEKLGFDLRECVTDVVNTARRSARAKGIEVRLVFASDLPSRRKGDPVRLTQILSNLIGNAIKFTEAGFVELTVQIVEVGVRFTVEDTGIGIRAAALGHIFDAFTQEDSSTTRRFGGTGLGLNISQRLVEMMEGKITAQSQVGVGSQFAFIIPLEIDESPIPSSQPKRGRSPLQTNLGAGRTALVVDDHKVNRLVAQKMLERIGFEVASAENGAEALDAMEKRKPDVVLMDCSMPVMDGYEATRRIRSTPKWDTTRIVAMTALALEGDREKCLEAGMDEYLAKPLQAKNLVQILGGVLASGV